MYHAIENTVANTINATYAQHMIGRLDVKRSDIYNNFPAFLIFFFWRGIISVIILLLRFI